MNELKVAGFWRRTGAALLDGLILGAVGWVIGLLAFSFWRLIPTDRVS